MRIKKSPIFNAPSPRPPFFRNPFCRGSLLARVNYIYKCGSKNRAGRRLGARRPAIVRDARTRSLRRLLPEYRCLFVKQALRLRAVRRRPTAADCNSPEGSRRPPPSANIWLTRVNYILYKCGSENRAGRSLCPAEARYSHSLIARAPQAATRNLRLKSQKIPRKHGK